MFTGIPVACACGEGVIDWKKTIEIYKKSPVGIVISVECGVVEQAERSSAHLKELIG